MASNYANNEVVNFYIGHHETKRAYEITEEMLHHAQDENYDMLTAPITNDAFHSRVLTVLSKHLSASADKVSSSSSIDGQSCIPQPPIIPRLSPSDTSLAPNDSVAQLIFLTSPWLDLCSPDPLIADISRQVLALEIAYASFCGATNVMIRGPPVLSQGHEGDGLAQYARAIQDTLAIGIYLQIHIQLPMMASSTSESCQMGSLADFARPQFTRHLSQERQTNRDDMASWDAWNAIRSSCKYSSRLSVALTIPKEAPSSSIESRWFSEPVRILEIPASSFHQTSKGLAVLSQSQRQVITRYMRMRTTPWLLLTDVGPLPGLDDDEDDYNPSFDATADTGDDMWQSDPTPAEASRQPRSHPQLHQFQTSHHLRYLRDLQTRLPPKLPIERFGAGYQDYLQNPLQPLTDNLESITYEVFEKDPVKYDWYERAITAALRDWADQGKPASGPNGGVVVAVVGAGRGPLVTRALKASAAAGVKIEMWAVEKNPNAFVLLQRHNMTEWNHRVHLVHSDMRSWEGPLYSTASNTATSPSNSLLAPNPPNTKSANVDILVSELLGSFADNELSPECLDGVQHLLNPTHGISIPSSYTAHLTPIAAPKLHADISARAASGVADAAQIPYVVMLHGIDYLCTDATPTTPRPVIQQAWEFHHPVPPQYLDRPAGGSATATGNEHNRRYCRLDFSCTQRGVCHGLGGYFETVLYDGKAGKVELSTNPETMEQKSRDMISWFPIYFPLEHPIYTPQNAQIVTHLWRQTDGRKVWYEWLVETFLDLPDGQRVRLGASELHSTVRNGCLM